MSDARQIRHRMQRLVARVTRRDAYGTLLASGQVIAPVEDAGDPELWRAAIRRQARADRIKVRTGMTNEIVWALLNESSAAGARHAESMRYMHAISHVMPDVHKRRHEPNVILRDGDEALFKCERCDAFGYLDSSQEQPLIGGELFEVECPHDGPPRATALTFFS
jgi:hypothetical protein